MKKLVAMHLAVLMVASFAGCAVFMPQPRGENCKLHRENGDSLVEQFESSFTSPAGKECKSSIKAEGCGFVIDIKIAGLNNLDDA